MSTELPELLCRVNFPLYQATMITPRHIMVAGGGGAANTGVFNGIVSQQRICNYKLKPTQTNIMEDKVECNVEKEQALTEFG